MAIMVVVLFVGEEFDADEGAEVGGGLRGVEGVGRDVCVHQRSGALSRITKDGRKDGWPFGLKEDGDFVGVHKLRPAPPNLGGQSLYGHSISLGYGSLTACHIIIKSVRDFSRGEIACGYKCVIDVQVTK